MIKIEVHLEDIESLLTVATVALDKWETRLQSLRIVEVESKEQAYIDGLRLLVDKLALMLNGVE